MLRPQSTVTSLTLNGWSRSTSPQPHVPDGKRCPMEGSAGMDLAEFLTARLDEDKANAQWWIAQAPHEGPQVLAVQTGFDGERVLREVEAKRAILAMHRPELWNADDDPEEIHCALSLPCMRIMRITT